MCARELRVLANECGCVCVGVNLATSMDVMRMCVRMRVYARDCDTGNNVGMLRVLMFWLVCERLNVYVCGIGECVFMSLCVCQRLYVRAFARVCVCVCMHVCMCACVCRRICEGMYVYVCMDACMYV